MDGRDMTSIVPGDSESPATVLDQYFWGDQAERHGQKDGESGQPVTHRTEQQIR